MLIGYARVSKIEQDDALQIDALEKVGCNKIFRDKISGAKETGRACRKHLNIYAKVTAWSCGAWIA